VLNRSPRDVRPCDACDACGGRQQRLRDKECKEVDEGTAVGLEAIESQREAAPQRPARGFSPDDPADVVFEKAAALTRVVKDKEDYIDVRVPIRVHPVLSYR
jgi:hypothetical protein